MSEGQEEALARYILQHLRERNGAELDEAIGNMRLLDFELCVNELALILKHGGKPPNWVR